MPKRRGAHTSGGFDKIISEHKEARGDRPVAGVAPKGVGKSVDPDYIKLTCYVRKETHLNAKRKLLDQGGGQLSEIVEELLTGWLKK